MSWNAKYALLLLFSTAVTYFCGFLVGRLEQARQKNGAADSLKLVRLKKLCVGITENYPDICQREMNAKQKERWEERYDRYFEWHTQKLILQSSLKNYLMMSSHPSYYVAIQIKGGSALYQDATIMALLKNISDYSGLSDASTQALEFYGVPDGIEGINIENFESDGDIRITVFDKELNVIDQAQFDASGKRIKQ